MNQSELKNTVKEKKTILERMNSRLDDAEERISNLEDRLVDSPNLNREKKKEAKKMRIV